MNSRERLERIEAAAREVVSRRRHLWPSAFNVPCDSMRELIEALALPADEPASPCGDDGVEACPWTEGSRVWTRDLLKWVAGGMVGECPLSPDLADTVGRVLTGEDWELSPTEDDLAQARREGAEAAAKAVLNEVWIEWNRMMRDRGMEPHSEAHLIEHAINRATGGAS